MPEWVGKTIGNVRIDRLLARGGMAEVYLGTHLNLERPVAIKLLHSYIEEEPLLLERFHREAKVVASLRHPNIVGVFDFDTIDGHPYIVMEYLSGPTLAAYLRHLHQRKKRLSPEQIAGLLRGLSNGLDYAHRQGVIHRDIKPGNIMLHSKAEEIRLDQPLTKDVEAIVTDFGLVRVVNSASMTTSGFLSGTPAYMSPEQARGDQIDQRTDIYSLGIVLYEMLAGRVPFEADNTVATLHMHIHTPPPPVPGLSPAIQAVLDRALAKNPEDRYRTSKEMARAFNQATGLASQSEIPHAASSRASKPAEVSPAPKPEVAAAASDRTEPKAALQSVPQPEPETPGGLPIAQEPGSPPKLQPQPEPAGNPKPARSRAWLGVGLFSLAFLSLLAFGIFRFLSAGVPLAKPSPTPSPAVTDTVDNPAPNENVELPAQDGMVPVTGGTYGVGTTDFTDAYHIPTTAIELSDFWIDQYPTTNAEYGQYLAATGAPQPMVWPGEADHPVTGVTWDQASAYCQWKLKRLPNEAEWEAAGRGPGANPPPYPWGKDSTASGNAISLPDEGTYAVGTMPFNKSPFGVFDMVGNIWEWVGEPYASGEESFRILRGGRYGLLLDLSYRLPVASDDARYLKYAGFRCAADQVK